MKFVFIIVVFLLSSYREITAQIRIEPDVRTMTFLGWVPQKLEINSVADNLFWMLYYNRAIPEGSPQVGFLNRRGDVVIAADYSMASNFFGNFANVIKDSIYGYVNKTGQEVLFENYDEVFFTMVILGLPN